ncbi:MAG: helix-turn-helix domain-containing protein [Pseudomonadota bacterium]
MAKLPGQPTRGSISGRPVMVLLDALGKRWTLRLLWELHRNGAGTFRELRARCEDVSPTSLNNRLKELRELNLIELNERGFVLTAQGRSLSLLLKPLDQWAKKWAQTIETN